MYLSPKRESPDSLECYSSPEVLEVLAANNTSTYREPNATIYESMAQINEATIHNNNNNNYESTATPPGNYGNESTAPMINKRPGRPSKSETSRDWPDEEINSLIKLWKDHRNLFDTKHEGYFDKNKRQTSLENILQQLHVEGINVTTKQISEKLTSLKTYYGSQKKLVRESEKELEESSSTSSSSSLGINGGGGGGNSNNFQTKRTAFKSNWKFYDALEFLRDSFHPRKLTNSSNNKNPSSSSSSSNNNASFSFDYPFGPPSSKSRKITPIQEKALEVMSDSSAALKRLSSAPPQPPPQPPPPPCHSVPQNEDEIFGLLVGKTLQDIPDCEEKDDLKLEIQTKMYKIKAKFRLRRQIGMRYNAEVTSARPMGFSSEN